MSKGPRVPRPEPGRFYESHTAAPNGPVNRELEDMAKAVASVPEAITVRIGQTPEQAIEDEVAAAMLRTGGSTTKRNRRI